MKGWNEKMRKNVKRFDSSEGNVWKYVFDFGDAVAEAVLYRCEDFYKRTVICCSVMSGCPVGCTFCGTGHQFIRDLSWQEITYQIHYILHDMKIENVSDKGERFQIMFMSMGEPLLNWPATKLGIVSLNHCYRNAELLISTILPNSFAYFMDLTNLSKAIDKIGLQFSVHKSNDEERNKLIPYKGKALLADIADAGKYWREETQRNVYINYCIDGTNATEEDAENLMRLFSPEIFNFTFSVVCSADETMKDAGFRELDTIRKFSQKFLSQGYNVRIFDPAGQDDIGGGCGQLWYVQKWMKERRGADHE